MTGGAGLSRVIKSEGVRVATSHQIREDPTALGHLPVQDREAELTDGVGRCSGGARCRGGRGRRRGRSPAEEGLLFHLVLASPRGGSESARMQRRPRARLAPVGSNQEEREA
jgi:hypothetical protein